MGRDDDRNGGGIIPDLSTIDASRLAPILGIYGAPQSSRSQPDYLFPVQHQRSLFQQMTLNCGLSYGSGLVLGGLYGAALGLRSKDATNLKLRVNAILNGAGKRGGSFANSFGTMALFYTCFNNGLATIRDRSDVYNEIGGAMLTGIVYKSTRTFIAVQPLKWFYSLLVGLNCGVRAAAAAGILAGSAFGLLGTLRHQLAKSGSGSTLLQFLPKLG